MVLVFLPAGSQLRGLPKSQVLGIPVTTKGHQLLPSGLDSPRGCVFFAIVKVLQSSLKTWKPLFSHLKIGT